jgi:drug/metabolite transporter (DMT)-like permease
MGRHGRGWGNEPLGSGIVPRVQLHRTSGRHRFGFALAFLTMSLWGALPIALKGVLQQIDPLTITWFRFLASATLLASVLAARGSWPQVSQLGRSGLGLLAAATVFLAANYGAYIVGLDWTTAADAQVVIQIAPILLSLGGIAVFGEHFTRRQWMGFGTLLLGLGLFFSGRLAGLVSDPGQFLRGNAMIVAAALTWVVYGLSQKQLLQRWASQHIMLAIYAGSALLFWPAADPAVLVNLDAVGAGLLAFCCLNTVLAYGAFSEALQHWEASRVSAVLALTPLATLLLSALSSEFWPELQPPQQLSVASWAGALLVVGGSLLTSLGAESRDAR